MVTLRGEPDVLQASEVDRELETLQENGARQIVVDLLEVPFLEPSVTSALLRHARRLWTNGGALTLVSDKHDVRRMVGTHLFGRLRVVTTLSAALHKETAPAPSGGA